MLKHNKLKPVGIAIRLMWNMDKWLLIHSIITSVIEAATPFAGILLSAYILDGLQAGEEFTEIISVSLAAVLWKGSTNRTPSVFPVPSGLYGSGQAPS